LAVALGARRERSEVAAGARLGEELAPDLLGRQRRPQVIALLLLGAELLDDRSREDDPDHVDERGHTGASAFLDPGRVVVRAEAAAAVVDGPMDARPPVGAE